MTLIDRLAEHVLENHPNRAVTALERLGEDETVERLGKGSVESAAAILRRLSPQYSAAVLRGVDSKRTAEILEALPNDTAARLIRRVDAATQAAILDHLQPARAKVLRAVLQFPPGTAGALMDPEVLALPQEISARDALQRVRKSPETVRYNLYVVDQDQRLVGALNLRELLIARGRVPLSDLMIRDPHCLLATADRATVIGHPGWQEVHSLPVVDEGGVYVGAIRYRVLRRLQEELMGSRNRDMDTAEALGEVIAAGARGMLDALAGGSPSKTGRDENA